MKNKNDPTMTAPAPKSREEWEARLAEIEARCKAATPGPWNSDCGAVFCDKVESPRIVDASDDDGLYDGAYNNCDFISYARQDIPDLLAYVRAMQSEVERVRAAAKALSDAWSSGSGYSDDTRAWFVDHMDAFESAIEKARQPK